MSEILDCRAVALKKKAHFRKDVLRNFLNFRTPFTFQPLSECICSAVRQQAVGYICATLIKGNSTTYFFSDSFPKFSVQLFQNTLIKSSVMEFSRVLDCALQSYFILKNDSTRDNFLKFLEVKLFPQKKSVMDSQFGSNLQYL